ncbi:MAG: virulence factor SrfB [Azospirillaceae bacterium]|nr:virulence factor SrfB [Azospirillaceae bacterium]
MTELITLIPDSGVQFWDIDLDMEQLPRVSRAFWEEKVGDRREGGNTTAILRELETDEAGTVTVRRTGALPDPNECYTIGRNQALEMHLNKWVPLPYFLASAPDQAGRRSFDRGPINWARGRICDHPAPGPGATHRLTLAFDTRLVPRADDRPYAALAPENSRLQRELVFVAATDDVGWFLEEPWIGEWLREMLIELRTEQRRGRPLRPGDLPNACDHFARYMVLLELLDATEALPRVKLLDVVSENLGYRPVAVDLVLDIGNARTCGILIEEHPDENQNLTDSYPLVLRDLSRPELVHVHPFESRVEFSRASFGRDAIARKAGRSASFVWASPVRVGPEAVRLAGARVGNEGATGLSSPKRYLWDDRPSTQGWRFNSRASDGVTTEPPVNGSFMALVTEDGRVLRRNGPGQPAMQARFSRSSLFTFMLAEILLQAQHQMNAPGNRLKRRDAEKPRRLRSILITVPPGMPVAEQKILRARANAAVQLAWSMLGWSDLPTPVIKADLDEATATQIVWLHNEVTERLQGDVATFFEMLGRSRPEISPLPSLRLASIDVGGGTTDLMVITYSAKGEAIMPHQDFRESFKIAGDDVLERIITRILVPQLETALKAAGVADARALLNRTLGQDQGGQSEQERHLRRLFVSTVLEPIGIALLAAYERIEGRQTGEALRATVGQILGVDQVAVARALGYIEAAARDAGATGFAMTDVEIVADTRQIEPVVTAVLGPMLADLCEVVWTYDCDALLLSGRPSRLRVITDIVLSKSPVPPHRVISMNRYRVGDKYPFRDAGNRIDDPKTTVVVGAALSVLAEGRLRNFTLRTRALTLRSTARVIGRADNNGQIRKVNELLGNLDLDGPPAPDVVFTMPFETTTQIAFRQLPLERWPATPLYVMEFANPENAQRFELPLKVTVRRKEADSENEDPALRETFQVEEVEDASGDRQPERVVRLRLQTIDDQDGYWRDTGRLPVS